ncbi:MAG: choice-of-anchor tandem repeat GloVer-containing protein [Planctomycetota bacterium]
MIHAFTNADGAAVPFGSVCGHEDWLYGTTQWNASAGSCPPTGTGGGSVYRIRPDGSKFQVVKSFPAVHDGHNLFHGLSIDGKTITGVTRNGGRYGSGTLFSVKMSGADFTVLHHFGNGRDGRHPYSGPVLFDNTLYGLTFLGGDSAAGVLYGYDGTYGVRHSFSLPGGKPFGSLTVVGEWLYGMVSDHRSTTNHGLIFRYRPTDDTYEVVHAFAGGSRGGYPYDSLTWDGGRFLYGTTLGYYPFTAETLPLDDAGVIFRLDGDSGVYEVIHDFSLFAGAGGKPNSAMLIGSDGFLYGIAHGTEIWGGAGYEFGTLYRLQPDGSDFEVLHTFDSMAHGNTPMRSLLEIGNSLYGTTAFGGTGTGVGNGTVWRYALTRG